MNRPLLACECVECPSHAGEREYLMAEVATLEATVARLTAERDAARLAANLANIRPAAG